MSDSLLLWDSGLILAALTPLCKSGRVAPLGRLSPTRPMLGELTILCEKDLPGRSSPHKGLWLDEEIGENYIHFLCISLTI